jgi:hypothetical protein
VSVNLGIGSLLRNGNVTDYTNNANTLTATNVGWATPQYLIGLSFRSPFPNFKPSRFATCTENPIPQIKYTDVDCSRWHVRPWSAFVNIKFAPNSSQTINGYVIGGSYSLLSHLDILVGFALTPVNVPSSGLRVTASQYVTQQQKEGLLLNFNPTAMLNGSQNAFDGFSLVDTSNKLIYAGTPLEVDYRGGVVVGVSFAFNLVDALTKTNAAPPNPGTTSDAAKKTNAAAAAAPAPAPAPKKD